jgi:hypothetical protein
MQTEIEFIKACGYRVFQRNPTDKYCNFTTQDGTRIGYAQWSDYRDSVGSVHAPSRENGTGFSIADELTAASLQAAIECVIPYWGRGSVVKYRNIEEYINANSFNRDLKEV